MYKRYGYLSITIGEYEIKLVIYEHTHEHTHIHTFIDAVTIFPTLNYTPSAREKDGMLSAFIYNNYNICTVYSV